MLLSGQQRRLEATHWCPGSRPSLIEQMFCHLFSQVRARDTHHAFGAPATGLSTLTASVAVTVDLDIAISVGEYHMVAV